jgi:hypothetical protein
MPPDDDLERFAVFTTPSFTVLRRHSVSSPSDVATRFSNGMTHRGFAASTSCRAAAHKQVSNHAASETTRQRPFVRRGPRTASRLK